MSLALEEKIDKVRNLINLGQKCGYLFSDEVNDILPADAQSSEEIDKLLNSLRR